MASQGYVVIKGRAGLGNRILSAVSGILYSELTGRRPIVDWRASSYSNDRENDPTNLFHHLYDSPGVGDMDELPEGASVWPAVWAGRMDEHPRHLKGGGPSLASAFWRATSADPSRDDRAEDVLVMWSFVSTVEWMRALMDEEQARTSATDLQRDILRRHLRPRPVIEERVNAFAAEHLARPSVGVQVRYTDRRARLQAIEKSLGRAIAKQPSPQVFIATDNRDVRDHFQRRWGAVSAPHWYPSPGDRIHKSPQDPDRMESAAAAVVDLQLLGRCDRFIGDSRSSFAGVASLLCEGPFHDARPLHTRWQAPLKRGWGLAARGPARPLALALARSFRR